MNCPYALCGRLLRDLLLGGSNRGPRCATWAPISAGLCRDAPPGRLYAAGAGVGANRRPAHIRPLGSKGNVHRRDVACNVSTAARCNFVFGGECGLCSNEGRRVRMRGPG